MKNLVLLLAACSVTSCIEWPSEEEIRERRCSADANDPGCLVDAGAGDAGANVDAGPVDAGSNDAGTDAGLDAGTDAGLDAGTDAGIDAGAWWSVQWSEVYGGIGLSFVGDRTGGTFLSQAGGNLFFRGFTFAGHTSGEYLQRTENDPVSAAYERDRVVVATFPDGRITVQRRAANYPPVIAQTRNFASTAVDLYPIEDGGLAVAAYGNLDGGLAVEAFEVATALRSRGGQAVACTTSVMRPLRILPTPDGGPGVVVGSVTGVCTEPAFAAINARDGGGFVGRFGGGVAASGFSFDADPNSPMALGIAQNDLWVVYRAPGGISLELAKVPLTAPLGGRTILLGNLTPVELLEDGTDFLVVGHGSGAISLGDGGSSIAMAGEDVFIARLNADGGTDLHVIVAPGGQRVTGAVWMNDQRLVIAGSCDDVSAGLCSDTGQAWILGLDPMQP